MNENGDFIKKKPRKDYQCDIRRRCDCGGHLKKCELQLYPDKQLDAYCSTCYKLYYFKIGKA